MRHVPDGSEVIGTLLARQPGAARVLLDHGMHCAGSGIAPFETISEVCVIYGASLDQLLTDLRAVCVSAKEDTS